MFRKALFNAQPVIEVRARRVGGATYQVPMEVRPERRTALSIRWLLNAARSRSDKSMMRRLAAELISAANNEGGAIKKKTTSTVWRSRTRPSPTSSGKRSTIG